MLRAVLEGGSGAAGGVAVAEEPMAPAPGALDAAAGLGDVAAACANTGKGDPMAQASSAPMATLAETHPGL
jgi:hypothetical protein